MYNKNSFEQKLRTTLLHIGSQINKPLDVPCEWKFAFCGYKGRNYLPPDDLDFKKVEFPYHIDCNDNHYVIKTSFTMPEFEDGYRYILTVKGDAETGWNVNNPQFMAYLNGEMVHGMDINHNDLALEPSKHYELILYGYDGANQKPYYDLTIKFEKINVICEKATYDFTVAHQCLLELSPMTAEYGLVARELNYALNLVDLGFVGSKEFYESVENASDYIDKHIFCGSNNMAQLYCVGFTHIDIAWLWTLAQTEEKVQRSMSTVIALMEKYPEYKFYMSQPQGLKYLKLNAPPVFKKLQELAKDGRFEPGGAMWLEADCNVTSGESLIRQIIHGKEFYRNEFGLNSHILWLPDVFGYSAALPQILNKTGVDTFITSKISWNDTNRMPYDMFMWQGVDGSEVFTSFITSIFRRPDYNADHITSYPMQIKPTVAFGTWERFEPKEFTNKAMLTYGYGDGGGGPTKDDLECARRLAKGVPGVPKLKLSRLDEYVEAVKKDFEESSKMYNRTPRHVGELYLERHRGTYTSIAQVKKNMRKGEFNQHITEAVSAAAAKLFGADYPHAKLHDTMETILLNQFHDILPGSSIKEVYEVSAKQFEEVFAVQNAVKTDMLDIFAKNTTGEVLVYNPTSFEASGYYEIGGKKYFAENVPAYGYSVISNEVPENGVIQTENTLENKFFIVTFAKNGTISSIIDKRVNREIVSKDKDFNSLEISFDHSLDYDAWEIEEWYKDHTEVIDNLVSFEKTEDEVSKGFVITRKYGESTIRQTVRLYSELDRIDVENEIDWKETHKLLKAAFPTNVIADEATYEIQFAHVKRPTHTNNSWDQAKFEVCAQKWADISDSNYGVSIMNDCKYGYNTEGGTMKLSLLKCAASPSTAADRHMHSFTYSIYPHSGDAAHCGVTEKAYLLNCPLIAIKPTGTENKLGEKYSFISSSNNLVVIDTVKNAEDGTGVIVRMYESSGSLQNAEIVFGFKPESVSVCDMLENEIAPLEFEGNKATVSLKKFEILTLKIK